MSSVTNPHAESPNHDELVAYLDGELAPEDCRRVEERLASDAEYRQQLRDLDQAWEALGALPATAVDDGFARTTIELACVAAGDDLSHRKALAAMETRSRTRWWIAGGVATAVMGFVMMRALVAHRNNAMLADLPVIEQFNALTLVSGVDFLRRLSSADFVGELVKDETPTFNSNLADYTKANASLAERREWVNSLRPDQKSELAARARTFEDLRQNREEKDRLRQLADEIRDAADAPALRKTLVAYGEWLSRHTPGQREQLRGELQGLAANEQVEVIEKMVKRENEQPARHLSPAEKEALRREIFELAKERQTDLLAKMPPSQWRNRIAAMDASDIQPALFIFHLSLQDEDRSESTANRLLGKLSGETNEHWKKLPRWPHDKRRSQMSQLYEWAREAMRPKWGPEDLEQFFASESLTAVQRQKLLDMPKAKMEPELERLYLKSQLGIDERWQPFREFNEGRQRNAPGKGLPDGGRRSGAGPWRPEGRPPGEQFGPEGPLRERFPGDRRPGPPGQRGVRPEDRPDGGPAGEQPRRPAPGEQPPPAAPI